MFASNALFPKEAMPSWLAAVAVFATGWRVVTLGTIPMNGMATVVALAAPVLAVLFTYSPEGLGLREDLVAFLRWMYLFLAMFNGVKMGGWTFGLARQA